MFSDDFLWSYFNIIYTFYSPSCEQFLHFLYAMKSKLIDQLHLVHPVHFEDTLFGHFTSVNLIHTKNSQDVVWIWCKQRSFPW